MIGYWPSQQKQGINTYQQTTTPVEPPYQADMGKLKVPLPTKEHLAEKDRKRKEKKSARKSRKSDPTRRPNAQHIAISRGVLAPSTEETHLKTKTPSPDPVRKRAYGAHAEEQRAPAYKTNLGLKDSSSIRSDPSLTVPTVDCLMIRRDRSILKAMSLEDIAQEAELGALKATNKTLEANNLHLKQATANANSLAEQAELKLLQAEMKWSETDQKLAEKNKELEALRLDFSHVAAERDELQARVGAWPRKKKIVYRKGVDDAYLRAKKEMILKFKAGQTSWATPEPSEDDSDDGEVSEISSGEDEPELNNESLRGIPTSRRAPHTKRTRLMKQWRRPGLTPQGQAPMPKRLHPLVSLAKRRRNHTPKPLRILLYLHPCLLL
ncbi:hypothetical protein FNV43_RR14593 [Rhamnella rubrinervis]|uniref:Uncharacterized protein n=1 Tax=Rhamnella rubrinervis TaxID=2594499 RepID=A0A8K0H3L3_9ROSA|nr:hypothetical protein FNV43_RR14593 [Rhamnella rubrinervis]